MKNVPEVLDKMADAVLAYRPKPKSKAAKKRARKAQQRRLGARGNAKNGNYILDYPTEDM